MKHLNKHALLDLLITLCIVTDSIDTGMGPSNVLQSQSLRVIEGSS